MSEVDAHKKTPHPHEAGGEFLAVAEGFEPSDGGYPSHAFEACSLGRSDTPPRKTVPQWRPDVKSPGKHPNQLPVSLSLMLPAASLTFSAPSLTADET